MFGKRFSQPPPFGTVHPDDDRDIEVQRPKDAARKHLWHESRLLFRDLIFALMVLALVMVFIIQPVKVEGTSMLPYLHDGERIFVNKLIYYDDYRWAPKLYRGDIVVFWFPEDPSKSYIKRVIGLPGDRIEVRGTKVFINGELLAERVVTAEDPGDGAPQEDPRHSAPLKVLQTPPPAGDGPYTAYYSPETRQAAEEGGSGRAYSGFHYAVNGLPATVPADCYFVMGDNRDNSQDSRRWGFVPRDLVIGRAMFV